jgi:hypothetical protein
MADTTETTTTPSAPEQGATSSAKPEDKLAAVREKHVKILEKTMFAEDGEQAETKPEPKAEKPSPKAKDKPKDAPEKAKAEQAKPDQKAQQKGKGEPEKDKPEGEDDEPADEKSLRHEKREFSKFRARETRRIEAQRAEVENIRREGAELKQRYERAEQTLAEELERDPIAFFAKRGKNVKQVLLDFAKRDSEDPKERLVREASEKVSKLEAKLTEREQRERELDERQREAHLDRHIEGAIAREWEAVADSDDYPYLSTVYEPAQIAELGRQTLRAYHANTGRDLTAPEIFARLERVLREDDERLSRARARARGESGEGGSSRSPDRDRTARSVNPEARTRPTTHDVSSRDTRISTTSDDGSDGHAQGYDRRRLIAMARERIKFT